MTTIDADTHVIETDRTWDFMEPGTEQYRPTLVSSSRTGGREYWLVDGELWGMARLAVGDYKESEQKAGRAMDVPAEAMEMADVQRRLDHMDELGIDVQFLYPTLFLRQASAKPAVDVALCRSYNRWLAWISEQSDNRLRWAMAPPLTSMADTIDEMRWSREHGAAGVFMRAVEGDRLLHDPAWYPVFEEAQALDLPITVHIGNSNRPMAALLTQHVKGSPNFWLLRLSLVGAFHALVRSEVPTVFPSLRFGFIEATSQWLPFVCNDLTRREPGTYGDRQSGILADNRFYVSCQTDDDLQYIMSYVGEDNLVIGTDYGHNDQASELLALSNLRESGKITAEQYEKLTGRNPQALYGI